MAGFHVQGLDAASLNTCQVQVKEACTQILPGNAPGERGAREHPAGLQVRSQSWQHQRYLPPLTFDLVSMLNDLSLKFSSTESSLPMENKW